VGVRQLYLQTLAERGYVSDPAQMQAVDALERCENEWADYKARRANALTQLIRRPPIPRGVYLHGGVGRGKSFLMDCFFQSVPLKRKTRLHFHEFMREVHRELQDLKGTANPLDDLGQRIARRFRLICFDEFHVADVTDAMILHRLLAALFANRVTKGQARGDRCRQWHRLPAPHDGACATLPLAARAGCGGRFVRGLRPARRGA